MIVHRTISFEATFVAPEHVGIVVGEPNVYDGQGLWLLKDEAGIQTVWTVPEFNRTFKMYTIAFVKIGDRNTAYAVDAEGEVVGFFDEFTLGTHNFYAMAMGVYTPNRYVTYDFGDDVDAYSEWATARNTNEKFIYPGSFL